MERLATWDAFQRCVEGVSRGLPGYTSNLYAVRDQIEEWCALAPLHALAIDGAVIVLRTDRDFQHVYHVASNLSSLTGALTRLPPGSYSTDLIGRGDDPDPVVDAYAAAGFSHHAYLRRMSRVQTPSAQTGAETGFAQLDEVAAIAAFLDRLLDRFAEQLPTESDLAAAVAAGRLLVVRRGTDIAGMLMYDSKGQLAHLRFWHVDADRRGDGVGRQLMAAFLSRCAQARRIVLWVMGDNERSIAIYRHYGFAEDGLLDRIMTLHKDQHQ